MKRILFSLLALVGMTLTASAVEPAFKIKVGTNEHGTFAFKVNDVVATPDGSGAVAADEGDKITLTITADDDWTVGTPSGNWSAAVAKTRVTNNETIDMLENVDLEFVSTDQNTGAVTYKFDMERADAVISCTYKKMMSNPDITVDVEDLTYTGSYQVPSFTVKDGNTELKVGDDYIVAYLNNKDAAPATATENAPAVVITAAEGSDTYTGSVTKTFTISPKALEASMIGDIAGQTYTTQAITPEPTITFNDITLVKGTDFTYSYENNVNAALSTAANNAPTVTITAVADGNYSGSASKTFAISPAELTAVTLVSDKLAYNEQEQAVQVQTVKAGDITVPADGFDVTDNKGTNVGNYTAKVTGKGNFTGTVDVAWSIVKGTSSVTFSQKTYEKTFGDEDFTVEPTVTGDGTLVYSSSDEKVATVDSGTGLVHILGTGTVTITATMSGDNIVTSSDSYELTVSPKQTTVTIGATGMITYCGTEALDFTGNEDLEAYTVIGCSYGSNTIWMSRVYNVPAETPIVIKAAKEGTYELNIATSTDSYYLNRLVGNLSGSTIQVNETSEDGTVRNYYLKSGEFKKVSNYANIANGKAYLQMPASVADEKAGSAVDITLSSTGKSTLCSDVDLDFSGVEGLKAYVVTGYDMPTKTFWLNRVVEASAGTPLYLAGKANTTYSIPSKGVKTSFENMLVGNLSGSTIQVEEESEDGALRNLYLKEGTFKKVNNYVNIYHGKCYLQAPSDIVAAMARGMEDPDFNLVLNDELMSIGFSDIDDEATGIVPIENGQWTMDNSAGAWYDLQGRKLQGRPTRSGVYVNNGRKVVLK